MISVLHIIYLNVSIFLFKTHKLKKKNHKFRITQFLEYVSKREKEKNKKRKYL